MHKIDFFVQLISTEVMTCYDHCRAQTACVRKLSVAMFKT